MSDLMHGDCLDVMRGMEPDSVDAIVTDPPYALTNPKSGSRPKDPLSESKYNRFNSGGFMGKKWDGSLPGIDIWAAALRVAKPGAYLLAFGGTRTFHRLTCAIEDAGWEIRDCLMWLYGSGFPKSLNVGRSIDSELCTLPGRHCWNEPGDKDKPWHVCPRTPEGIAADHLGTSLKPAWEPIIMARKPLIGTVAANVQKHGTGGINVDGCRVGNGGQLKWDAPRQMGYHGGTDEGGEATDNPQGRWPANVVLDEWHDPVLRLRGNVNPDVARVLRLYYGEMPSVPEVRSHIPEPQGTKEVLRQGLLCEVAEPEGARQEASDVRQEAHAGIVGEDASGQGGEPKARGGKSELEGRKVYIEQGLSDGQRSGASVDAGTSPDNGTSLRPTVDAQRGRSSSERDQDGQQDSEPGIIGSRDTQAGTQRNYSGITSATLRERAIEVCASEVPQGWLIFFEPTGRSVRCGSAAMLDRQSGERTSGAHSTNHRQGRRDATDRFMTGTPAGYERTADSGGASRFYYCAKSSRSEREAGLDGEGVTGADATDRKEGTKGLDSPRAGAGRTAARVRNFHPT